MSCSCFGGFGKGETTPSAEDIDSGLLKNIDQFSYNQLRVATDNFNFSRRLGRGGFGSVYKGILKNGAVVAVKTLSVESKQGDKEFLNEINSIANVEHPNLVGLIGCCVQGNRRILVYEYLENKSLDRVLLGQWDTNTRLHWSKRSEIILGIARALAFLHEELVPHIVHRDIKASNILLDKDFKPKLGDFGLAKLFPEDITHISTKIAGTTGYLAPEYALGGHLTMKADVYSFGILVLEIISARNSARANWGGASKLLLEYAWELHVQGKLLELVDSDMGEFPEADVLRYMKIAFFCTQAVANRRPAMSQIVEMLSNKRPLKESLLSAPGFFQDMGNSRTSDGSNRQVSSVKLSITDVVPR